MTLSARDHPCLAGSPEQRPPVRRGPAPPRHYDTGAPGAGPRRTEVGIVAPGRQGRSNTLTHAALRSATAAYAAAASARANSWVKIPSVRRRPCCTSGTSSFHVRCTGAVVKRNVMLRNSAMSAGQRVGLEVVDPEDRYRAPGPHAGQCVVQCGVVGHRIDDRVGPPGHRSPRVRPRRSGRPPARPPSRRHAPAVRPRGRRPGPALRPRTRAERTAQQPDRTEAQHHDRAPRRDVGPLRTGPTGREVVGQQQGGLVVHAVGDPHQLEVGGRHGDRRGLTAGEHARAEDLWPLDAQDRVAGGAAVAHPATGHGCRQHPVPHLEPPDVGSDLEHGAEEFVAHRDPRAEVDVPVVEVHVGAADGGGVHRDDGTARPGHGRLGRLGHPDAPRSFDHHVQHGPPGRVVGGPGSPGRVVEYCGTPIRPGGVEQCRPRVTRNATKGPDMRNPHAGEPFDTPDAEIAAALVDVSIPTLLLSLVHMTGDPGLIGGPLRPAGHVPQRGPGLHVRGGQGRARALALDVIRDYRDRGCPEPAPVDRRPAQTDDGLAGLRGRARTSTCR